MSEWSQGAALSLTKLLDPAGDDPELPVYLFGMHREGHDWTFATWNEVPAHEGGVASVSRRSVVGQAEVHMNAIHADDIPGYATYFWAVPQHNVIASVRFTHNVSGQEGMRSYVERFLTLESGHVVEGEVDGEMKIVGYSEGEGEPLVKVYPKFRTSAFVKAGHIEHILRNHARIRKVIRRGHLSVTNRADRGTLQHIVQFLRGRAAPNQVFLNKAAYVQLEYTPTLDELREMIAGESEDPGTTAWDDMGFVFQGEPNKKYWVGKSLASENFELDIERDTEATVNLESLSRALHARRAAILRLLRNDA
ncbi:hypothetical protein [Cupriavidus sp. BIC8F]|uniref:hypothetical protein n=1 Tax=Cupriavidus sp. BIC8F TaxID=3079014 RepID=UPI00291653FC|nr:hypothetical protein [Cupriavidus sp. BIC8F]